MSPGPVYSDYLTYGQIAKPPDWRKTHVLDEFWPLSSYLCERISLARHQIPDDVDRVNCRQRLLRCWTDLVIEIETRRMRPSAAALLERLGPGREFRAAGYWFSGRWHPDGKAMHSLLRMMGATHKAAMAAYDLHYRYKEGRPAPDDDSWDTYAPCLLPPERRGW